MTDERSKPEKKRGWKRQKWEGKKTAVLTRAALGKPQKLAGGRERSVPDHHTCSGGAVGGRGRECRLTWKRSRQVTESGREGRLCSRQDAGGGGEDSTA